MIPLVIALMSVPSTDTHVKTLALVASEVSDGIILLTGDDDLKSATAAAANALSEVSLAMAVAIHQEGDSTNYHLDRARGALTAAIELTRGGAGLVPSLKGERDHAALYPLRKARSLLEGLRK